MVTVLEKVANNAMPAQPALPFVLAPANLLPAETKLFRILTAKGWLKFVILILKFVPLLAVILGLNLRGSTPESFGAIAQSLGESVVYEIAGSNDWSYSLPVAVVLQAPLFPEYCDVS